MSDPHAASHSAELDDRHVATLLAGGTPEDTDDFIPVVEFIAELRSMGETPLPEDVIAFYATEAASAMAGGNQAHPVRPRSRRGRHRAGLRRNAISLAATMAMLFGATGMAWAADGAVPGEWNYGLDRALERVGIGAGGEAERLEEQRVISARQAADVGAPGSSSESGDPPEELPADDQGTGRVTPDNTPQEPGKPDHAGPPEDKTRHDTGPPDDKGRSDDAGPPEDKSRPDDAGPPEDKTRPDTGPPDHAGPPEDKGKPGV